MADSSYAILHALLIRAAGHQRSTLKQTNVMQAEWLLKLMPHPRCRRTSRHVRSAHRLCHSSDRESSTLACCLHTRVPPSDQFLLRFLRKQQNTVIYSHMSDQWWIQKFWTGEGGRQFISPVLIYRKCTQRPIAYRPFTRKKAAFWKKIEPIRGGGRLPSPFESATVREWAAHRYTGRYVNAIQSLEAKWGE